jgi:hypothetical protein
MKHALVMIILTLVVSCNVMPLDDIEKPIPRAYTDTRLDGTWERTNTYSITKLTFNGTARVVWYRLMFVDEVYKMLYDRYVVVDGGNISLTSPWFVLSPAYDTFEDTPYTISADGKTLTVGINTYTKL